MDESNKKLDVKKVSKDKIGILTWHYYDNFGSALQAYALQEFLIRKGCTVEIINYRNVFDKYYVIKQKIKEGIDIFRKLLRKNASKSVVFERFRKSYLNETSLIIEKKKLEMICRNYKYVICGSDQIWAPNVFNPIYMLDFIHNTDVKKISYAASIGLMSIPDELNKKYANLLSDFEAISVREDLGKELLLDRCGINATTVLDPTFLLDSKDYEVIKKKFKSDEDYIFCYFLNNKHKYRDCVMKFAQKHKLKIYGVSASNNDDEWMKNFINIGPDLFLGLIEKSKYVFTDSYHGTIFSIIYKKQFFVFERFAKDNPINQNSRIFQLADMFNIYDRILSVDEILFDKEEINYEFLYNKLKYHKALSTDFLVEVLSGCSNL